jgi:hypothetical protein
MAEDVPSDILTLQTGGHFNLAAALLTDGNISIIYQM